jgi:hypothetical protein
MSHFLATKEPDLKRRVLIIEDDDAQAFVATCALGELRNRNGELSGRWIGANPTSTRS